MDSLNLTNSKNGVWRFHTPYAFLGTRKGGDSEIFTWENFNVHSSNWLVKITEYLATHILSNCLLVVHESIWRTYHNIAPLHNRHKLVKSSKRFSNYKIDDFNIKSRDSERDYCYIYNIVENWDSFCSSFCFAFALEGWQERRWATTRFLMQNYKDMFSIPLVHFYS